MSLSKRSAFSRLAASLAPTTSWWWKRHPAAVLEPAGRRLADVVQQRGQAQHQVGPGHRLRRAVRRPLQRDRLLEHGERVLVDVLVPVVLVDLQLAAPAARAAPASARPVSTSSAQAGPRRGRAAAAWRTRRAPARPRRSRAGRPSRSSPPRPPAPRRTPSWAANRAARIIRSGSSANDSSRRARACAARRGGQVGQAVVRVDELQRGQPQRHRVDGEVAAHQVVLQVVAERHLGLAGRPVVGVRAVGRHLDGCAGAAPCARRSCRTRGPCPSARRPSRGAARSVCSGVASVVKSRSGEVRPRKASRTGPPTSASSWPAPANRSPSSVRSGSDRGEPAHGLLQERAGRVGGRHESQG